MSLACPQVATAVQWTKAEGSNGVPLWIIILAILFGLLLLGLLIYVLYKVSHAKPWLSFQPVRLCLLLSRIKEATLRSVFQHRPPMYALATHAPSYLFSYWTPPFSLQPPVYKEASCLGISLPILQNHRWQIHDGICAAVSSNIYLRISDGILQVAARARLRCGTC